MKRISCTAPSPLVSNTAAFVCLLLLSALLLTACGDDDVRFTRIDDGSNPEQMAFHLLNQTGRNITLGHPLLYVQSDDAWEKVPFATEPSWPLTSEGLGVLGEASITIPVKERYGALPEGEYQVRLDYTPIHYITENTGRHTAVYAFSIP